MRNRLPELTELEKIIETISGVARVRVLDHVVLAENSFPLYSITLGSSDPKAPSLGMFAGVHGLERIGSKVVISYLKTIAQLMTWDETIHQTLQKTRLVFMPLINPAGMYLKMRSNANGVDLMRNAPVEGEGVPSLFLAGGHRISPKLPWYRGPIGGAMESEAKAVCNLVREEIQTSNVSVALDVHSGYGTVDRIWFPYAKTIRPFPNLAEIHALKRILDDTYPNHIYQVEPQAKEYTTHGDLWDYLYDDHREKAPDRPFIPLALELGSWNWVKKNPKQIFSALGAFNPLLPHRRRRTLRRHLVLFDFLLRAVASSKSWASLSPEHREKHTGEAMGLWYGKTG